MIGIKIGIQYQGIKATFAPFYSTVVQYLTARMLDLSGFMYWLDGKGVETRTIQPGRAYLGDGVATIDFGATLASTTITYFNGTDEDTIATDASGVLTIPNGVYFGNAYVKSGATYLHFWQCTEGSKDQCFDSVSTAHGTIEDATLSTFHATNPNFISKLNDDGYNDEAPTYSQLIPLKYDSNGVATDFDIFDNVPTHLGRVKYNTLMGQNNCLQGTAGSTKYVDTGLKLTGGKTYRLPLKFKTPASFTSSYWIFACGGLIAAHEGFCMYQNPSGELELQSATGIVQMNITTLITLSVSTFYDGEFIYNGSNGDWSLVLNELSDSGTDELATWVGDSILNFKYFNYTSGADGFGGIFSHASLIEDGVTLIDYRFSNGAGAATIQNVANPGTYDGTLVNFNTATDWVQDDGATAWNTEYGFDKWEVDAIAGTYNYIPFDNNGNSILTEGDDYAGHTWVSTNPPISGKVFMNGSETELLFPEAPALQQLDADNVLFDVNGNAQYVTFDEVKTLTNPIFFRENGINLEELTIYEEALAGAELYEALNYFAEYSLVMEFTDNAADTSTLWLNSGGDFAMVDWTSDGDYQEISTSDETESNVIPTKIKIFAKNGVLTYFRSTNNNFAFDIGGLPAGLTYYLNTGNNVTSGDLSGLPAGLTYYLNTGNNVTSGDLSGLPAGLTYYLNTGNNVTSGDLSGLPAGLTYYLNTGNNETSGDLSGLPAGLTTYYNEGQNTTSGDLSGLPAGLTFYRNIGNNVTSGDLSGLPAGLTYYYNIGNNVTSGDLSGLPAGLTFYRNQGNNVTSGALSGLPASLTYYVNTGLNRVNQYTAGHTFSASISYFRHNPAATYGLTAAMVDNLLIDLDNSGMSSGSIYLDGNNEARTAASNTAVLSLETKTVTVVTS